MAQRIAVSGSAGVGKSTLTRAVAAELGLPWLPEGMREYLVEHRVNIHDMGRDRLRALVLRLWHERLELEAKHAAFVADRSSYDFAAFWLFYGFGRDDVDTRALFAEALRPDRYDALYLLPWGRIPLVADGVRAAEPYLQLQVQSMIVGLCTEFGPPVRWVEPTSLEARVALLCGREAPAPDCR